DGNRVVFNDNLDLSGALNLSGALTNTGIDGEGNGLPVTVNDGLEIFGELTDGDGTLIINDDLAVYSSLNAQGAIFNSTGSNGGTVLIEDSVRVNDNLHVGYDGSGELTVDGRAVFKSAISNSSANNDGRVYIDDGMNVRNNTTIGSDGSGNLTVNGNITATGRVSFPAANREVTYEAPSSIPSAQAVDSEGVAQRGGENFLVEANDNTICFLYAVNSASVCAIGDRTLSIGGNAVTYHTLVWSGDGSCQAKCYEF
ncbi:MAG: hypothetical protein AAFX99_35015, partial [Myxococcota bacterium]